MRVFAAIAVLGLAGCNLVFGLEPPGSGAAIDATADGNDQDGDGGGTVDASGDPCAGAPAFCARFSTGLTDDGFRPQPTVFGSASIGRVAEVPLFARARLDDSSFAGEATIVAPLAVTGPERYVVSFLARGRLACGAGGPNGTPMTMFQFTFPSSAITAFVRRTGDNLEIGSSSIAGNTSTNVAVNLSDRFHLISIDVDFPGDKVSFTIDGNSQASVGMPADPAPDHPATVVVGLQAAGSQPDCEMDYDDIVVNVR